MASLPNDIYLPESQSQDKSRAILMITGDNVEDLEFFYPFYRFIEAGYEVDVATLNGGSFKGKHGLELKQSHKISDIDPTQYLLLYLPGGAAPENLKRNKDVLSVVRHYVETGRPVAALCHGPQILAAAGVIKGRKISAWPGVESEIKAAGASYVNQETCEDGQFITGRWPGDLPAHLKRTLAVLKHSETRARAAA